MLQLHSLASYRMEMLDTHEDPELQQRLGLYRVFLRLYEHHRELLDEILSLENFGSKSLGATSVPYIQAVVDDQQVYLITNLLKGETQALRQPQNIWVIGRDSRQAGLSVPDRRLSRCHAAIRFQRDRGFELIDLGSSNGSFVNGEIVSQPIALKDGDRIRLGGMTVTFFICKKAQKITPVPPAVLALLEEKSSQSVDQPSFHPPSEQEGNEQYGDPNAVLPPCDTLLFKPSSWHQ